MSDFEYYDRPASIVESQIGAMSQRADTALAVALATMNALGNVGVPAERGAPWLESPVVDLPSAEAQIAPIRPDVELGDLVRPELEDPDSWLADLATLDAIPTFTPSVGGFQLPEPPAPLVFGAPPEPPEVSAIALPAPPDLTEPSLEALDPIEIPPFAFPVLPTFAAVEVEWEASYPPGVLNWSEPTYTQQVLTSTVNRINEMLMGGTGLPAEVEQALFDRARNREEIGGRKAVEEAFGEFAARGFSLPPGALAARIQEAREAATLATSAINRDILAQSAQWEIENLRQAVQQGIALESLLMTQHSALAGRALDAAKLQLQAQTDLLNAQIAVFNARQGANQIRAQVFETRMRGALAELETQKAQLEALKVRGELNEQRIRIFTARWQAMGQRVEVYKAQMQGAQAESDLYRGRVEAYRARVQAWGEQVQADKLRFDAYDSRMKGEQAKADILEAESRAFAATVQAHDSRNNLKVKQVQVRLEGLDAMVRKFVAELQAQQAHYQSRLGRLQAETQLYLADIGKMTALVQADTTDREIQVRHTESTVRNNLAHYEILVREYDARMTRLVEEVKVQAQSIQAAGQMASQLAAGAMSAMHVQASLSGSGSKSGSSSTSHNYNYDMT